MSDSCLTCGGKNFRTYCVACGSDPYADPRDARIKQLEEALQANGVKVPDLKARDYR
jgi:hypothetical protein